MSARQRLADTGSRHLDALSAAGAADPALRVETALGYKRRGDVAGNAAGANLGRRAEAGKLLETAFAQLSALAAERPQDRAVQRAFAETAYSLAVYRFIIDDDSDRAIDAALTAEAAIGTLIGGGAAAPADRLLLAQSEILLVLGEARGEAGDKSVACAAFSEALSLIGADGAGASDYYESGEGKAIRDGAQACA